MRVAFITFEYPPYICGGAGVYAYNITKELARLGIEVHVICPWDGRSKNYKYDKNYYRYETADDVVIHRINFVNRLGLAATTFWINLRKDFKKIEKRVGKFDVIHGNVISDFSLSKKITNVPRVITTHHLAQDAIRILKPSLLERISAISRETGIVTPHIEKICINRADKIIAVSNYTKRKIIEYYSVPSDKIRVIYNGMPKLECDNKLSLIHI